MKKISLLFLLILLVGACGEGYDTEAEVDKVLAVHDEVMPKMGEVMKLKKDVLAKVALASDSTEADRLRDLAQTLDNANTGMMVWMRQWSATARPYIDEEKTVEERKAYFALEMEKVEKVKSDINSSIATAQEVLK